MERHNHSRHTGRTTRMIERAKEAVARGDNVVVMVAEPRAISEFKNKIPGATILCASQADKLFGTVANLHIDHYVWDYIMNWSRKRYFWFTEVVKETQRRWDENKK